MQPLAYSYIRFSTPEQAKGNSLERQLKASRDYCKLNGLRLDDSLTLKDLGKSAFHGRNVKEGALGAFLAAVDDGRVKRGSHLLVESLDRLSRQAPMDAFGLLQQIVTKGISVVTLADGKTYTKDSMNANVGDLFLSLGIMLRAHDESMMKSKRIRSAWASKRKRVETEKLTAICPAWLTLAPDRKTFIVNTDRAKVVQRIFRMALEGKGKIGIASALNSEAVPTFGKSDGWQHSYIDKILNNPAVLGEYQTHRLTTDDKTGQKKRIPDGEPVANYYPPIVKAADFHKVQLQRKRGGLPKGRKGKTLSNLLTGLAVCSCGSPMHYVNKGKSPKGGQYLVCSRAMRGVKGCSYAGWRYRDCEAFILMALQHDLMVSDLLPTLDGAARDQKEALEEAMAQNAIAIQTAETQVERILAALETGGTAVEVIKARLEKRQGELGDLKKESERLALALSEATSELAGNSARTNAARSALQEWVSQHNNAKPTERFAMRERMSVLLRDWVSAIRFQAGTKGEREVTIGLKHGLKHHLTLRINPKNWTATAFKVEKIGKKVREQRLFLQASAGSKTDKLSFGGIVSGKDLESLILT